MGFSFWGPSKGPARAQSDLANKLQDPRTPVVSTYYLHIQSAFSLHSTVMTIESIHLHTQVGLSSPANKSRSARIRPTGTI